ncbi:hypothetical protein C6P40_005493 [Pichia californica]|uniref:Uncharacterized protein n=1 Tax=Pichia californica TaxID=460514 RepID=A0A9P6WNC5_9ASCO|nr:hypothetical protein C6P42_000726 [[Candida] californica]KAG0689158.1 hypothetical protein C6P40_005493 [[Candida] californica]
MVAFKQVDVFTLVPFKGNPVAVIIDASKLTTNDMKSIANWTNLSETTFVIPPTNPLIADYKVRIFVPSGEELPFAGHPTIGTAFALLESGIIKPKNGKLVQECLAGLINLTVTKNNDNIYEILFQLPDPIITKLNDDQIIEIENILGSPINRLMTPSIVNVGPKWLVVNLKDAKSVIDANPNFTDLMNHDKKLGLSGLCIFGFYDSNNIEVRSFAPSCGVNEDPVCGSGNGSVTSLIRAYYDKSLDNPVFLNSTQGKVLGRDGHINLQFTKDKILIGGHAVTCIEGNINI